MQHQKETAAALFIGFVLALFVSNPWLLTPSTTLQYSKVATPIALASTEQTTLVPYAGPNQPLVQTRVPTSLMIEMMYFNATAKPAASKLDIRFAGSDFRLGSNVSFILSLAGGSTNLLNSVNGIHVFLIDANNYLRASYPPKDLPMAQQYFFNGYPFYFTGGSFTYPITDAIQATKAGALLVSYPIPNDNALVGTWKVFAFATNYTQSNGLSIQNIVARNASKFQVASPPPQLPLEVVYVQRFVPFIGLWALFTGIIRNGLIYRRTPIEWAKRNWPIPFGAILLLLYLAYFVF